MTESPRTAVGRLLLDEGDFHESACPRWVAGSDVACTCSLPKAIAAIEAEAAATAPLDLERLRRALRERYGYTHPHADVVARQVAEAYARLQASAPPLDPEQT